MADDIAIRVDGVSKTFRLPHEKNASIKGAVLNFYKHKRSFEKQTVLNNVSFEVKNGEFFGIVGRNGSGKSTMLKMLAGIYTPTRGSLAVNGRLTPFIELGVGFNPELTGRENVFLNGALLGFNRKEMLAMYDDIVKFAELERFMDQKLKNYSSGMQVRLAFSIAIKVESDILLLDEVLAVGDAAFQKKCFDFFRQLKKEKRTVIFISHDMNAVREYCDKAVLIEAGKVILSGSPEDVAQQYTKILMSHKDGTTGAGDGAADRWGNRKATTESFTVKMTDERINIAVVCKANEALTNPIFGLTIHNPTGVKIFETNTKWRKLATGNFAKGQTITIHWEIANILTNGENYLSLAISDSDGLEIYDWWNEAGIISVDKDVITSGLALPEHQVTIKT